MSRAYYNEIVPYTAQWLRNLITAGLIAPGDVDERDIRDVVPADLDGYTQCHFFAGIGGWSYALRLAGWPDDQPVWTGSCPCQPFSQAGRGAGFADERHLWPAWSWLIGQRQPDVVFGEQVASPAGRAWLDLVSTDMEGSDHTFGACNLPAAGVGAPGLRQRLWFVALANSQRCAELGLHLRERRSLPAVPSSFRHGQTRQLGDAICAGLEIGSIEEVIGRPLRLERSTFSETGTVRGRWADADWIWCRDSKYRPVEPGTFPLATRLPGYVEQVRAYGNAIVPQVAAIFIQSVMETL